MYKLSMGIHSNISQLKKEEMVQITMFKKIIHTDNLLISLGKLQCQTHNGLDQWKVSNFDQSLCFQKVLYVNIFYTTHFISYFYN